MVRVADSGDCNRMYVHIAHIQCFAVGWEPHILGFSADCDTRDWAREKECKKSRMTLDKA